MKTFQEFLDEGLSLDKINKESLQYLKKNILEFKDNLEVSMISIKNSNPKLYRDLKNIHKLLDKIKIN